MFTSFDRAGHRQLSAEISTALVDLGKRLGVTFSVGGGQIGATDLTIKVVATSADTSVVEKGARREIDLYGRGFGLTGDDYGTVFVSNGKRFKFTGISPSRPKYPIDGECFSTGRAFKFGRDAARKIIDARPKAPSPTQAAVAPATSRAPEKLDPRYAEHAQF